MPAKPRLLPSAPPWFLSSATLRLELHELEGRHQLELTDTDRDDDESIRLDLTDREATRLVDYLSSSRVD